MGCSVNGYGEMLNSHIGIIGKGQGKVDVYHEQKLMYSNISELDVESRVEALIQQKEMAI